MHRLLNKIQESQNTKLCLLLGFCFISALVFISRPYQQPKLNNHPSLHKMSGQEDEFPGEVTVGGLGGVLEKNDEVVSVVEKIKPMLEDKSGLKFESLEVIHYKPQLVAGKNYFVKAKAKLVNGEEKIVHLRIYQDLQKSLELTAYQLDKKLEEAIEYF